MTDEDSYDEDSLEATAIGVGMGGSCPSCRAPVDLGQEFCLECGAPIRFTPKQRQKRRTAPTASGPVPAPRRGSGFPWLPFLIVLALVGGGIALALVDGGDSKSSNDRGTTKTEDSLPTITNETEPPPSTSSMTTTLEDCDPARPLDGTVPAVPGDEDDTSTDGFPNEQIPELGDGSSSSLDDGSSAFDDPSLSTNDLPSVDPSTGSDAGTPVTVDQNGNLCPDANSTTPSTSTTTDPSTNPGPTTSATNTTGTTSTTSTTGTTGTTSGSWPSGRNGWTVIVSGYDSQSRAQQRAADVQEDGFSDSGVLFSSDFTSLCPGIYVVYSGVLDTEAQAKKRLDELAKKPDYAGMYVREIRTGGSPASGCRATT